MDVGLAPGANSGPNMRHRDERTLRTIRDIAHHAAAEQAAKRRRARGADELGALIAGTMPARTMQHVLGVGLQTDARPDEPGMLDGRLMASARHRRGQR